MACTECRRRKLKCDEARPACVHCARRDKKKPNEFRCIYDVVLRKRGPDKHPGARPRHRRGHSRMTETSPFTDYYDYSEEEGEDEYAFSPQGHSTPFSPASEPTVESETAMQLYAPHPLHARRGGSYITPQPSQEYHRSTWWDLLLSTYHEDREIASKRIFADLKYLFTAAEISFIHFPTFLHVIREPRLRVRMQPSMVLAALSLSTLLKTGSESTAHMLPLALRLREQAQQHLEASIVGQWFGPSLAQAAWFICMFDCSGHGEYSTDRALQSLDQLDCILQMHRLTMIDAPMDDVTVYHLAVPITVVRPSDSPPGTSETCSCMKVRADVLEVDTVCPGDPGWDVTWEAGQIQQEEIRRVCWSSLRLVASHIGIMPQHARRVACLSFTDPQKFCLYFPGEALYKSGAFGTRHSAKDAIWSLAYRAILLFQSTMRQVAVDGGLGCLSASSPPFGMSAWSEILKIESLLSDHVACSLVPGYINTAKAYVDYTLMLLSAHYHSVAPNPDAGFNDIFSRERAIAWLNEQKRFAWEISTARYGRERGNPLRPYLSWSLIHLAMTCLALWERDRSLSLALETCVDFRAPIEELGRLWPCDVQQYETHALWMKVQLAYDAFTSSFPDAIAVL
ncbi:hypothetical protein BOTBODRAFT_53448 [Botryobasidium botryosum FD-172 SS1]|uniref:Zn(2)-C6 fungal-type domain-containing protein n=1 Tax=Botryobasidium botryosum (strain FD-172 SS1) TaxID=930990 RepID=A0A067N0R2_BOTB1|nr:hypothetical protein BOTBODRAFT_53448 [Botryobasidium botryosum FD-172 SS1]